MKNYEYIYQEILDKELTLKERSPSFNKIINIKDKLNLDEKEDSITKKKIGDYILGKKLGQGTFGIVVLAKHQITGESVAIKILDKDKIVKESDKTRLEREIRIMKIMYHNNIVHLYNVIENSKELYLIMEYIPGKELFDYIINKKHLDEIESCKFYQQILSGIEYLGKTKVAHRDLKPENLLLDSKKNIKIVDFGLSNTYFQDELLSTACGSPCYAAPEMLSGKKYNGINIDIWSSGIVLYAMLCGYLPFEDNDNPKLYKKIIKGVFETPEFLSPLAVDLLHRILNVDPEKRYTIEQIKKHPWFNQLNPKFNMSEGLLIEKYVVPFDEEIINQMVNEYSYNEQLIKVNLLVNKHNHITTTYFLILRKKIRMGKKSIGDMTSQLFIDYINDEKNLLSSYDNDLNSIIIDRILNIKNQEKKQETEKEKEKEKEKENEKENEKEKDKDKENICKNENKIDLKKFENNAEEYKFKYYENNISKIKKHSKYKQNNVIQVNENVFNTIEKDKLFETLETDKKSSCKRVKVGERKNIVKKNNLITYVDEKESFYKHKVNFKSNYNRKKIKSMRVNNNINTTNSNANNSTKNHMKNKSNQKNTLSQKYFYSTFTENNVKNFNKTNEDISIVENNHKQIINRISLLKETIIKSMNDKNKNHKTTKNIIDNSKDSNICSNILSPHPQPHPHCFSNKNFFTKIKPNQSSKKQLNQNNQIKYSKIDTSQLLKDKKCSSSKERQKKLNLNLQSTPNIAGKEKHRGHHEIIKIIQRIKDKTKDMNNNSNSVFEKSMNNNGLLFPNRSNFTKTNFYINSASRVSRTPNNIIRDLNNRVIYEHNINNDLNRKIYEINFDNKSNNNNKIENNINSINNNGNNINIHINLTNIYKNIRPIVHNKEESIFSFKKDKIKIKFDNEKSIKNINDLIRKNKFKDNNKIKRKYFIDTSVSLEKMNEERSRRRKIESENKENRFLIYKINNKQETLNNFKKIIDKNHELKSGTMRRENEDTSVQRKEKDLRYLKIKSKNKKFSELNIKKMNSLNSNDNNTKFNSIIHSINLEKKNLIRIKKKSTISNKNIHDNIDYKINHMSINLPSFYNVSNNNSNIKINNSNNKSLPKKTVYNTKQIFKSINTDFNQSINGKYITSFNFFPHKSKESKDASNLEFFRDRILKNQKLNVVSDRVPKKNFDALKSRKSYVKKSNFLKPFDLNSLVFVNNSNIREKIGQVLHSKDINYNEVNSKFNCYKKDIKFELAIINVNEFDGIYIIKSFQKPANSIIKLRNYYNNIIFRLINSIK